MSIFESINLDNMVYLYIKKFILKLTTMKNLNYKIDGTETSATSFFETLRILTQYQDKKAPDFTEKELRVGITVNDFNFKITVN